jgi:hypothetical protein
LSFRSQHQQQQSLKPLSALSITVPTPITYWGGGDLIGKSFSAVFTFDSGLGFLHPNYELDFGLTNIAVTIGNYSMSGALDIGFTRTDVFSFSRSSELLAQGFLNSSYILQGDVSTFSAVYSDLFHPASYSYPNSGYMSLGNFSGGSDITYANAEIDSSSLQITPLPAALPLFTTGLGALGLLGWRRKKKGTATLAA